MPYYRASRNFEASIIDYIKDELTNAGFTNIPVEKAFAKIYNLDFSTFAGIAVRLGTTAHKKVEVGSESTIRDPQILIDIFATSDGQRLDLKDFLISVLKGGLNYYEYTITNGAVSQKTLAGRIKVRNILDAPINFGVDKSSLDVHDRHRHSIVLTVTTSQVES